MRRIIFFVAILLLVCCKNENGQQQLESEGIPIEKSISKIINKRDFPIKKFSKIELVSYYNRVVWDTIKYKDESTSYKALVDNYKLTFDSTMIQERVALNRSQEKELINLLISDTCIPQEMEAGCYNPRHMILFRDEKNRIIGYNEFCTSCIGSRNSRNLEGFQKYCYADMAELFRKFGIKLFVEYGDGNGAKEYNFFKSKGFN